MNGGAMGSCKGFQQSGNVVHRFPVEVSFHAFTLTLVIILSGKVIYGSNAQCGFNDCWDLYQLAQESLRISDVYPLTWVNKHSLPSSSLIPAEIEKRCTAFRTFYKCLALASRGCLGDLNFHSAHKGTEKQMNIYGCSSEGPLFEHKFSVVSPVSLVCTYSIDDPNFNPNHRMCGIFGDLHLVMFDEEYQTCNIVGTWPVFDNEYFTIQVTAERLHLGSHLAKVTIVIKQDENCALADRYVLYQATSLEMPTTFSDGSTALGAFNNIRLEELEANRHIAIVMHHIDTTIWIHSFQNVLSIFVKTPDEFANSFDATLDSVQLCFTGCPNSMQVKIQSFFEASKNSWPPSEDELSKQNTLLVASEEGKQLPTFPCISYGKSYFLCKSSEPNLKGYFLDSCIYDIMSSCDSSFAVLSAIAMNTTLNFVGKIDNRKGYTEPHLRRHASHGCSLTSSKFLMMLVILCNLLNHSMKEVSLNPRLTQNGLTCLIDTLKILVAFCKSMIIQLSLPSKKSMGFLIYSMLLIFTPSIYYSYLKAELYIQCER